MDVPKVALRIGVVASLVVAAAVLYSSMTGPAPVTPSVVLAKDGTPLAIPTQAGVVQGATWQGRPVLVIVAPARILDGVDAVRGAGEATPSVALPGSADLRLFALSAISTGLGCTVGFNVALGASRDIPDYDQDGVLDGRALDPCHQSQWDVYHRGVAMPNQPASVRLAVLDVRIVGDQIVGNGFDGPIGAQRHL